MYRITRAVLPGMLDKARGRSSTSPPLYSSEKGAPRRFAYGASKAAIIGMTKAIAADFVKDGIRCNAICPGTVQSPSLNDRLAATGDFDKALAAFKDRHPWAVLASPRKSPKSVAIWRINVGLHNGPVFCRGWWMVDLMRLDRDASIDDLRLRAKKRIPRFAFDLVDGGAENERNMRRNSEAFEEVELTARYMVDVSQFHTTNDLRADLQRAFRNGANWNVECLLAQRRLYASGIVQVETFPMSPVPPPFTTPENRRRLQTETAGSSFMSQATLDVTEGLIARAEAAGYTTLMVTADVPAAGKRDRDIRNQLAVPFRFTPEVVLQCVANPIWALTSLRHGTPNVANHANLLKARRHTQTGSRKP